MGKIKKLIRRGKSILRNSRVYYIDFLELPIDEKLVLIEGGQGSNINGNMFSMLKELNTNPRWADYKTVFVATDKNIEKARERMEFYGFKNVIISLRNTKSYAKYLATAKYLMTDNSFPPYFYKRDEQVFLNTWHGTPLKTLGKSDLSNNGSPANIQKNYLMSDYALFPNDFTRNVFMEDYGLKFIMSNKTLIANYPRNYVFYDKEQAEAMKEKLGYKGKKIFAYMPTWRGTGRKANTQKQLDTALRIMQEFEDNLDDDTVLLVNLHFLLASNIDCDEYKHIDYFDTNYDTYEVLNACDGLITDYSSVFFDYAVTGKKIILYAYDKADYLETRGVYIPFESLPFPILETTQEVVDEMKKPVEAYDDFVKEYCPNGYVNQCERLFDLMTTGKSDCFTLEDVKTDKPLCFIYAGRLLPSYFDTFNHYIAEDDSYNYLIVYRRILSKKKREFIMEQPQNVSAFGTITVFQFKYKDMYNFALYGRKLTKPEKLDEFFTRERDRLFYGIKPDKIVDFSCGNTAFAGIMNKMTGDKYYVNHGTFRIDSNRSQKTQAIVKKYEESVGFKPIEYGKIEDELFINKEDNEEHIADISFKKLTRFMNIIPLYIKKKRSLVCFSSFTYKTSVPVKLEDTWLTVGNADVNDKKYPIKYYCTSTKRAKTRHRGFYKIEIPLDDMLNMPALNPVVVNHYNSLGFIVKAHIFYTTLTLNKFLGLRSPMVVDEETNSVAIYRQSQNNRLNIYVRSRNESDSRKNSMLTTFAFIVSKLWFWKNPKSIVLLYEKNSSKFEESASVLYEKLMDDGYKNAYFIVAEEALGDVPEKYRSNVLIKNTFKHYLYFFKAYTFIGTETLVHSYDLKTFHKLALAKIASKRKNYVFLQHGVMYMVSLDSQTRILFKRQALKGLYKVVVSSRAEADHFVNLGRHYEKDVYITGLPKFDKNVLNDDADKITIMPTWRPWEINETRNDFIETKYFKMIMRIYDSVPEHLKDKVLILPHPLIMNELQKLPSSVTERIVMNPKYDQILRNTRLLITDYSSIAYDAFYRGTRVIFYWEEKDECMEAYGSRTKLMLNEENVFGDFFYNTEGLSEAIEKNYNNEQTEEYKERYSKIVEFHDGKNTERLINFLKEDGII